MLLRRLHADHLDKPEGEASLMTHKITTTFAFLLPTKWHALKSPCGA